MALLKCDFYSDSLGMSVSMNVILPQETKSQIGMTNKRTGEKAPVLYLLHGMSDDHTIWSRRTSVERYVAPLGLAVIMPAVARSYYADMASGPKYWTFISDELPVVCRSFFNISDKREETFVAGLSMGGYGAFKLGLTFPDRFAAAASLSGALDIVTLSQRVGREGEFKNIFGDLDKLPGSGNDLFALVDKQLKAKARLPRLYQCCGTEDQLCPSNVKFRDYLQEKGVDLTYDEEPAVHEWGYWDRQIQKVLKWLPL